MRDISYLVMVILLTAGILIGLFFYNKGTIKEISGTLALNQNVSLNFERVATKPAESNRYYVIFYVDATNNSSIQTTLMVEPPTDPCDKYDRYNYYQSPSPNQMTYQQCLMTNEYQQYQQKKDEYQLSYQGGANNLELMTPQNQKCELNASYQINNKYPNIGYNLGSYTFQANEKKVGSVVFDCPEKTGKFIIKYRTSSLDLNI